jgi:hypothetical protein
MCRGLVLLFLSGAAVACGNAEPDSDTTGCAVGDAGESLELRCTGLYSNWPLRTISPDVESYTPGIPLWSDGALKSRWVYLPPGTSIDTSDMDEWTFPVGTKLWKQFIVDGQLVETRLLWKQASGWYRTTYRWSADGTNTVELTTGGLANGWYEIPSQLDCYTCHEGQRDGVMGFSAVSLSLPSAAGMTLDALAQRHLITDPPATPIVVPGSPLDQWALGFLHINCGIVCHNEDYGYASWTGFFMRLDVAQLSSVQATNTWQTGVNEPTEVYSVPGIVARIAAGNAIGSCVHYRMGQRNNDNAMPPLDSHVVDDAGLQLIGEWIDSLDAGDILGVLDGQVVNPPPP